MSNAFLTTVLGGIIVALIGGIIAFYFGGIRERQRQVSERQDEINELRADALSELRNMAHDVVEALEGWAENVEQIPEKLPDPHRNYNWDRWDVPWDPYFEQWLVAINQASDVAEAIEKMRRYYRLKQPNLEAKSQRTFEVFDEKVTDQHTLLWNALGGSEQIRRTRKKAVRRIEARERYPFRWAGDNPRGKFWVKRAERKAERADRQADEEAVRSWQERMDAIREAVRQTQQANLGAQLATLDKEAEEAARIRREGH